MKEKRRRIELDILAFCVGGSAFAGFSAKHYSFLMYLLGIVFCAISAIIPYALITLLSGSGKDIENNRNFAIIVAAVIGFGYFYYFIASKSGL